jgi:hypothetical protein
LHFPWGISPKENPPRDRVRMGRISRIFFIGQIIISLIYPDRRGVRRGDPRRGRKGNPGAGGKPDGNLGGGSFSERSENPCIWVCWGWFPPGQIQGKRGEAENLRFTLGGFTRPQRTWVLGANLRVISGSPPMHIVCYYYTILHRDLLFPIYRKACPQSFLSTLQSWEK